MKRDERGWKRARRMRKWRNHKGGLKPRDLPYLHTPLGEELEEWTRAQRRAGLRPASYEGRRLLVRRFLRWCSEAGVTRPEWLSRGLLEAWLGWLDAHRTRTGGGYADNTKEGMIRAVNSFLSYLLERRRIDANPLAGTRLRRCRGVGLPVVLDEEQVGRLLEAPDVGDALGVRDRAMLELTNATKGQTNGMRELG